MQKFDQATKSQVSAQSNDDLITAEIQALLDEKRIANNQLQEQRGNIRVYCRVKPLLPAEIEDIVSQYQVQADQKCSQQSQAPQQPVQRLAQSTVNPKSLCNPKCSSQTGGPSSHARVGLLLPRGTSSPGMDIEDAEDSEGERNRIVKISQDGSLSLSVPVEYLKQNYNSNYNFRFEYIYDESCSQSQVFHELSSLIQSAMDGFNVCIFAYGQTGSGKTYTMNGTESSAGLVPRSISQVYQHIGMMQKLGWRYKVQASFTEIYNE